jgi:hypothetical protein
VVVFLVSNSLGDSAFSVYIFLSRINLTSPILLLLLCFLFCWTLGCGNWQVSPPFGGDPSVQYYDLVNWLEWDKSIYFIGNQASMLVHSSSYSTFSVWTAFRGALTRTYLGKVRREPPFHSVGMGASKENAMFDGSDHQQVETAGSQCSPRQTEQTCWIRHAIALPSVYICLNPGKTNCSVLHSTYLSYFYFVLVCEIGFL